MSDDAYIRLIDKADDYVCGLTEDMTPEEAIDFLETVAGRLEQAIELLRADIKRGEG